MKWIGTKGSERCFVQTLPRREIKRVENGNDESFKKKILVVGGTGMLGKPVVSQLHKSEYEVTVLSRNMQKAKTMFSKEIAIVVLCKVSF